PLRELAATLMGIKRTGGAAALSAYIRNMRIPLLKQAKRIVQVAGPTAHEGAAIVTGAAGSAGTAGTAGADHASRGGA
ncbi:MAG: hypothetical protein K9L82_16335, partial [Chromatiaceae bacterium]|nr:hypothetical protein [Chromatiaceae bacterium]